LRVGGRQIAITSTGERRVCFDLIDFYHNLSRLVGVDTMKLTPRDIAAIAQNLRSGFETGALKPPAVESVPFENAIQAYERLVTGKTNTKQVLTFSTN
jgi:NADPH:quinone reductase-like Zn-dependent oxidoreductase